MFEKKLKEDLFNQIKDNSTIAIFGACPAGARILEDIKKYKNNVNVICFIDNFKTDEFNGLKIFSLKEFIDKNIPAELVIMASRKNEWELSNILRMYDYSVLTQTWYVYDYYRDKKSKYYNQENYQKIINIFDEQQDKDLFDTIFKVRAGIETNNTLLKKFEEEYCPSLKLSLVSKQYLDKINKKAVKIVFDLGFNSGLNAVAYNKFLPNLEYIYGFDAIYERCKEAYIEDFIKNNKLKIIDVCIADEEAETSFIVNPNFLAQSLCKDYSSISKTNFKNQEIITSKITTLDNFCKENNIYPDLIKTDIEGAELPALYGGINTIQKHRPQLAISIYHSDKDFIEIPLYLHQNLKDYTYKIGHYRAGKTETVLYAIPKELQL